MTLTLSLTLKGIHLDLDFDLELDLTLILQKLVLRLSDPTPVPRLSRAVRSVRPSGEFQNGTSRATSMNIGLLPHRFNAIHSTGLAMAMALAMAVVM